MRREIILLIAISASVCGAGTITVNWDGTGDYTTIQAGIDAAVDGDIVLVADGTYTGIGNWGSAIIDKSITVRSTGGAANCIIDGEGVSAGFYLFGAPTGKSVTVEGFTVTNSRAYAIECQNGGHTVRDCIITSCNGGGPYGGVLNCFYSEGKVITLENCTFDSNSSGYGGAVYCMGADVLIKDCEFTGNTVDYDGGAITSYGSGAGNIRIMGCEFTGNSAGVDGLGGAVHIGGETVAEIAGCTFDGNTALNGGAVCCEGIAEIKACQIIDNDASFGGGVGIYGDVVLSRNIIKLNEATTNGGGIWVYSDGQCSIDNCLITENNALMFGGGLRARSEADVTIANSTICDNTAAERGGGLDAYMGSCRIANSIIWGNDALGGKQIATDYSVSLLNCDINDGYENIEGGVSMMDCIHAEPLFVGSGDYSLQWGSPCIDAGNNEYMAGYKDLAGQYRLLDGDGDSTATVDMGAYEFCPEGVSVIQCSDDYVCFTHFMTGPNDDEQSIIISNTGDGLLDWGISEDIPWLEVIPSEGIADANGVEVVLNFDASQLAEGVYSGALSIIDPDAMNNPFEVEVHLCVVGDGLWVPRNYPTIQAAIDAASAGQTVYVADGVYTGEGNYSIEFLGKAITVRSITGAENCIVNCRGTGIAFDFGSGEGNDSVLDGFTLTGAYTVLGMTVRCYNSSPTISNCIIRDNKAVGILCSYGAPIITNCLFSKNVEGSGGGGVSLSHCSGPVSISNCEFVDNSPGVYVNDSEVIIRDSVIKSNGESGVLIWSGSAVIERCVIEENRGVEFGGGVFSEGEELLIRDSVIKGNIATKGGGIFARYGSVEISNCEIGDNEAIYWSNDPFGGGIYCYSCEVSITGCTINGNYGEDEGGGVYLRSCSGRISSCVVAGNYGLYEGGGIYVDNESDIDIDSCTIAENRSQGVVAGVFGATTVTNSILWRNDAMNNDYDQLVGVGFTDYCVIGRNDSFERTFLSYGGVGNMGVDPLFVQDGYWDDGGTELDWSDDIWVEGDYRLEGESPCIDAGPVESYWGAVDFDIMDQYRPLDGDEDGEAAPDMGAYEYVPGSGAVIRTSKQRVYFTHETDGPGIYQETITIYNSGDETLNWVIEDDCPWLTVSPEDGVCDGNEIEVLLTVDTEGLAPDVYLYDIQICDASALNSPFEVSVVLYVVPEVGLWVPFNYGTIQAAVDAAVGGDTVIVADGVYRGEGNKGINYSGKNITVRSATGPDNCVIDCEGLPGRSFVFITGEGPDSILEGFTIKNPYSESTDRVLCMNESSPTIKNCVFVGNPSYDYGGALKCLDYSSPRIEDCIFLRNISSGGGAVYFKGDEPTVWNPKRSEPVLSNCKFLSNWTYWNGGGAYFEQSYPTIIGCSFVGNSSFNYEGGGCYFLNCEPVITNCIFKKNMGSSGSGIYANLSDIQVASCLFSGSWPDSGLRAYECEGTVSNSTFVGNRRRGASVGEVAVTNCIFWENYAYQVSAASVTYSDVQGGKDGEGNIDADPLFAEAGYWDDFGTPSEDDDDFWVEGEYHLKSEGGRWDANAASWVQDDVTSPCIDAGNPASEYCGEFWPHGGRINMGAYGGTSEASMSLSDVGSAADMNCDEGVDLEDFGELSGQWQKQEVLLKEDIDRDGEVSLSDLVMFCEEWLL